MSTNYAVIIEPYAERHYIKSFAKKYRGAWDITWRAVLEELKRLDSLFSTSIAEIIVESGGVALCKTEFRVAGTKESKHASGNRCIIALHRDIGTVRVLLVYHKDDLGKGNETTEWKNVVRENYPAYRNML